jgi:hypothetical protein
MAGFVLMFFFFLFATLKLNLVFILILSCLRHIDVADIVIRNN